MLAQPRDYQRVDYYICNIIDDAGDIFNDFD